MLQSDIEITLEDIFPHISS